MRIYLIGFMCSGKSTVGSLLSRSLNIPFYDVDEEVQKREGLSIPQIFEKKGEAYFRKLEFKVLKDLSEKENVVISTGGGLGANEEALNFMKSRGTTVFIDIPFEVFLERCKDSKERPLLKRPLDEIKNLFEERRKIYSKADIKVKGEKPPEEVVKEILLSLEGNALGG